MVGPQLEKMLSSRFDALLDNRTEDTMIRPGMASPLSRVEAFHGTQTRALLKQLRHTIEFGDTGVSRGDEGD